MHADFDKVWATATDLGMIAHLHVGMNPGLFHPASANTDDPAIIRLISLQNPHHSAQVFLTTVVFGGVLKRHPNLTVLVSELGIDWFPGWVNKANWMAAPGSARWWWATTGGRCRRTASTWSATCASRQYLRRTRTALADGAGARLAVFSSDYPHYEGNPNPLAYYDEELRTIEESDALALPQSARSPSPMPAYDIPSDRGTTMIEPAEVQDCVATWW